MRMGHQDVAMEEEEDLMLSKASILPCKLRYSCEDPQQVSEYSKDIFDHMFSTERSFQPRPRRGTAIASCPCI